MIKLGVGILGVFVFLVALGSVVPEVPKAPANTSEEVLAGAGAESTQARVRTETDMLETPDDAQDANVFAESSQPAQTSADAYYSVVRVVDGDTLAVDIDGTTETIRLIGINTPETVDPRTTVECFGVEASNKAKELLTGARVRIETDAGQGLRDKYGRLLAYIHLESGLFFNKYMIAEGYAYEYTYNTPYKYRSEFQAAQVAAERGLKGLWAPEVCAEPAPAATHAPAPAPQPVAPATSGTSSYSCSANTYNCGDFATHAEAQSVYEACGGVARDVHALDADKDGLACETLP